MRSGEIHIMSVWEKENSCSRILRVTIRLQSLPANDKKRNLLDGKVFMTSSVCSQKHQGAKSAISIPSLAPIYLQPPQSQWESSIPSWLRFLLFSLSDHTLPSLWRSSPPVGPCHTGMAPNSHSGFATLHISNQRSQLCWAICQQDRKYSKWKSQAKTHRVWGRNIYRHLERDKLCLYMSHSSLRSEAWGSQKTWQTTEGLFCVTLRRQESFPEESMYLPHFDQKLQCRNMFVIWNRKAKISFKSFLSIWDLIWTNRLWVGVCILKIYMLKT